MVTRRSVSTSPKTAARRLSGPEREKNIALEAVRYFAEVGFIGDTRELAKRLGITQSLFYKYFSNKEALINCVYEEVQHFYGLVSRLRVIRRFEVARISLG